MQALNIISAEHRGMWRLTTALESIARDMHQSGADAPAEVIAMMLDYLGSYIGQMHHPKEDAYLFRILRERSPQAVADIDMLQSEHFAEAQQLASLHSTALAVARGERAARPAFFESLDSFIDHTRKHIRHEETTVMPLAREVLTEEDWREIDAAFLNNDDPLFGANAKAEFAELRANLVRLAPDPVGLGGAPAAITPQAPAAGAKVLEIKGLTSHYGRIQALRGVDIEVREGQLVALVGANGAGKTTLLRTLSGVQPATGGSISLHGRDITQQSPDKRVRGGICQVPEGRQVFGPMSIEDNLRLGGYTRPRGDIEGDLARMYELFPILKEKRHLPAGTLSGGQQQMLAMARALMGRPRLLLLDEPSMGLAPLLVEEIFRIVKNLKTQGITILLVEQNAHAALAIADVGYVIETGSIILSGPGPELLENEQVKAAYLGM
ncbi:MAG TPA: ABC transporter [Oxalobacteraceae bacterium]|nr:ABC transporter [Oxalobacteraceae bacterium]